MKQKVRINCCSHATPDGRAIMGQEERLRKKLENGTITESELRAYAAIRARSNAKKSVIVSVFGKRTTVSIQEYNKMYKPLGFKAL